MVLFCHMALRTVEYSYIRCIYKKQIQKTLSTQELTQFLKKIWKYFEIYCAPLMTKASKSLSSSNSNKETRHSGDIK